MRLSLKFTSINSHKILLFCRFALINPRINFVKKTFFALIFFPYIYIAYFLYIKCVFLIDSYSNWVSFCFIFSFFHNHVNLAFVLFRDFTRKLSDVLTLPVMVFFGIPSPFMLFSDLVSLLHACPTGGKARNEPRTSSSFGSA